MMSKYLKSASVEGILEWLDYDKDTGEFRWKKPPNKKLAAGSAAGYVWNDGSKDAKDYIRINFSGKAVFAHNAAFMCMTGRIPDGEIDHINGIGTDNRWSNLRDVTHRQNGMNQKMNRNNKSGAMGVAWHKATEKWCARIKANGKEKHLGLFATKEQAIAVRKAAEIEFGYHPNHGREENDEQHSPAGGPTESNESARDGD